MRPAGYPELIAGGKITRRLSVTRRRRATDLGSPGGAGPDALDWTGPATASRLAQHLGISTGAMTGVIDRLEAAGLVRRERDRRDRRKVIVVPDFSRLSHLGDAFAPLAERVHRLYGSFNRHELSTILRYLHEMCDALEESTAEFRRRAPGRGGLPPQVGD